MTAAAEPNYPPAWRAHSMLAVLVLAYIVSYIDRQILALMVNLVRTDLALSDFEISLVQGLAFAIFYCVMGLPLGRMADRMSRTRLIAAGIVIWSLATVACGLSTNFLELFAARLMVGFGEAVLLPAGVSLLVDMYEKRRQVRAISIFTMGGVLGGGLAFLVGGAIIEFVTRGGLAISFMSGLKPWQQIFVLVGMPGLLLAPLLLLLREPARKGVSAEGHVPFSQAFALLWSMRGRIGPYLAVASLLAVFSFAGPAWYATHLIRGHGLGPAEAGLYMGSVHLIAGPLGIMLGAALTERFVAIGRAEPHLLTGAISAVIALAGIPAMLVLDPYLALAFWALIMVGQGAHFASLMGAIQAQLPNQYRAVAAAVMMISMTTIGLAGGASAVGLVSDYVFAGNPRGIGLSLAVVTLPVGIAAFLIAMQARKKFAAAAREAAVCGQAL